MAEKWKGFEANADLFPNLKLVLLVYHARTSHKGLPPKSEFENPPFPYQ